MYVSAKLIAVGDTFCNFTRIMATHTFNDSLSRPASMQGGFINFADEFVIKDEKIVCIWTIGDR